MQEALKKEAILRLHLKHPLIKEIRGKGLMIALIMQNDTVANTLVLEAQNQGLILFWLLFEPKAVRITPPLTITHNEIIEGCHIILGILNKIEKE